MVCKNLNLLVPKVEKKSSYLPDVDFSLSIIFRFGFMICISRYAVRNFILYQGGDICRSVLSFLTMRPFSRRGFVKIAYSS